ncbi:hypothetical protein VPH35_111171 [Triticum aestivum]
MAFGRTPFKGKNRKETFRNVLHRELTDLISRLLQRDPARRLGYAGSTDEIRAHPFFAGMAWDMLVEATRLPYIPPPAEDNSVDSEGFDVRDYFKKLYQPPAPPPPESGSSSSLSSSDFSSVF